MKKSQIPIPKYDIGDNVLIKGTIIEIERVLTINHISIKFDTQTQGIWYSFKQSTWSHHENDILKEVKL